MAAQKSVTTKRPFTTEPPAGVCIHEFAMTIHNADRLAPAATISVAKKCTARGTRCQPSSMMLRNPASSMNAMAPSKPSTAPKNSPAKRENSAQLVPNSNSSGRPVTTPTLKLSTNNFAQKRAWR